MKKPYKVTMYLIHWMAMYWKKRIFYTAKEIAQEIINTCEVVVDVCGVDTPVTDHVELGDMLHTNMYTAVTLEEVGEWPKYAVKTVFHGITIVFPLGERRLKSVISKRM